MRKALQPTCKRSRDLERECYTRFPILFSENCTLFAQLSKKGTLAIRQFNIEQNVRHCGLCRKSLDKSTETVSGHRGAKELVGEPRLPCKPNFWFHKINLVVHRDRKLLSGTNFIENTLNGLELQRGILIGTVDNLKNKVGFENL